MYRIPLIFYPNILYADNPQYGLKRETGKPLNWTKSSGLLVFSVKSCPNPPDLTSRRVSLESRCTSIAIFIYLIAHQTLLTEHGSQVLFCVTNDQQRFPNISLPPKASFQPYLSITKHGKLWILKSHRVHAKRGRYYFSTNCARFFLILFATNGFPFEEMV